MKEVIQYMKDNKLNPLLLEKSWLCSETRERIFNLVQEKYAKDGCEFICEEGFGFIEPTNKDGEVVALKLSLLVNFN